MHGLYWGWPHSPFWGGGVIMMIFWICVVFLIVSFLKAAFKKDNQNETPLDILKKRYAVGEISEEEFHQMKKVIN